MTPSSSRLRSERVYRGPTRDDCLRQAAEDEPRARAAGYVPISQTWSEEPGVQVLTVLYEQQLVPMPAAGGYPVAVTIDRNREMNRLWGIPALGFLVRYVLLIPWLIVLGVLGFVMGASLLVTWIAVLAMGRIPRWALFLTETYLRLFARVLAYQLLLAVPYPGLGTDASQAVQVTIDPSSTVNRLWGIPIVGFYVRLICVIPSAIVLSLVALAAFLASFVTWIPVLITGRYPAWGYDIVGGYIRWTVRYVAWIFMAVGPYPPFSLS